jgi:tetratricopeptide (TPR) repeat protein
MAQEGIDVLEGVEDLDARKTVGRAWKILGSCFQLKGNYDESLRCHEMGKVIGEELNDLYGLSAAYNNIGNVTMANDQFKEALKYYEIALELMEKTKDLQGKSYTLNNMGVIYKNMGDYDKALEYYEEGLRILEKIGDQGGMASSLGNIGSLLNDVNRDKEAVVALEKSLKIARRIGDNQQIINNLCALVTSRIVFKDLERAEIECKEAQELSIEIGAKRTELGAIRDMGLISSAKNQFEEAEKYLIEATCGFRELSMDTEVAKTLLEHGVVLLKAGKKDQGKDLVKNAKDMFESAGMDKFIEDCNKVLEQYCL